MNPKLATPNTPRSGWSAFVVSWLMLASSVASAESFVIDWWSLGGGGSSSTGGAYAVSGIIGQSVVGSMSGGTFMLSGGISGRGALVPVTNAAPLTVSKLQVKLNFAKPSADSCSLTATLDPGAGFSPTNKLVTLNIGGAEVTAPMDAKGRGVTAFGTFKLSYAKTTGLWTLTAKMSRGSWQANWASFGLVNATIAKPGNLVMLPVEVDIGADTFRGDSPSLHYTATAGKAGSAR